LRRRALSQKRQKKSGLSFHSTKKRARSECAPRLQLFALYFLWLSRAISSASRGRKRAKAARLAWGAAGEKRIQKLCVVAIGCRASSFSHAATFQSLGSRSLSGFFSLRLHQRVADVNRNPSMLTNCNHSPSSHLKKTASPFAFFLDFVFARFGKKETKKRWRLVSPCWLSHCCCSSWLWPR
jgi:hypothetical protein